MVIIIGAGLSGLVTGYKLKAEGIPFLLLEARDRIGGRILTINSAHDTPVEMGATWFGPQHQHLIALLKELGLGHFEQFMDGTSFYQPHSSAPPSAFPIPDPSPSYRISGGTSSLIQVLKKEVGNQNIRLNQDVQRLDFSANSVTVTTDQTYVASEVVLTVPPRIWATRIQCSPSLPEALNVVALTTQTWMESSIKVAVTYGQPFWRMKNQSGAFFSNAGPLIEFYDHCNAAENRYALCGFVHPSMEDLTEEERKAQIIRQLVRVFGKDAASFADYSEVLWSNEMHTHGEGADDLFPHQNNGHPTFQSRYYNDRLYLSGSESSPAYPGYMDGAVYAGLSSASDIIKRHEA